MEYEKIKQLMDDMGNSKLSSIEIEFPDGTKISMTKDGKKVAKVVDNIDVEENIECSATAVETKQEQITGNIVKSPMVGTFYAKPSPTAEPFVEVGQVVKKGETLCIIEAMKLMNEIESEFDGKIKEILVSDGEAVEYGKPLFIIE
ncbi:MAG: acetyl-CoA carboxylase biotin carboxyl carrier protein [Clostridia bacterium]|nr:acetyl-CoA carboxylase biotin carboxyl carrier protein [Clostridia bacterium]